MTLTRVAVRWRYMVLRFLHLVRISLEAAAMRRSLSPVSGMRGLSDSRRAPRRVPLNSIPGISKMKKDELTAVCQQLQISLTGAETRAELLQNIYEYQPTEQELAQDSPATGRRRALCPDMPGISRMPRQEMLVLARRYAIEVPPYATNSDIRSMLYEAPPLGSNQRSSRAQPTLLQARPKQAARPPPIQEVPPETAEDQTAEEFEIHSDMGSAMMEDPPLQSSQTAAGISAQAQQLAATWTDLERQTMLSMLLENYNT